MRLPKQCQISKIKNIHTREMSGYIELGMMDEARRLAREYLDRKPSKLEFFEAALELVLQEPKHCKKWPPLVESSFSRLSEANQRRARLNMMFFYGLAGDYVNSLRFIGKRMNNLFELVFAFQGHQQAGRNDLARALIPKLRVAIQQADYWEMRTWMKQLLRDFEKNRESKI